MLHSATNQLYSIKSQSFSNIQYIYIHIYTLQHGKSKQPYKVLLHIHTACHPRLLLPLHNTYTYIPLCSLTVIDVA